MLDRLGEHAFLIDNLVVWAILALAAFTYAMLIELCFLQKMNSAWYQRTRFWYGSLQLLLAALPLLGLLGTISGLLETFTQMSLQAGLALQELVTGGIGEAMFTTQLGLVMVVPGLLMLSYLHHRRNSWILGHANEIVH